MEQRQQVSERRELGILLDLTGGAPGGGAGAPSGRSVLKFFQVIKVVI
jgi:hypothetical protein